MAATFAKSEMVLIRHGATLAPERLCGRTDVALGPDQSGFEPLADALRGVGHVISSPAQRCHQTARLFLPKVPFSQDERLWEQDFGDWEDTPYAVLPDIGDLDNEALAAHRPPEGESFLDVVDRVKPALDDIGDNFGPQVVFTHAGVIRAALGLALGCPSAGLRFEVGHLSMTRLRYLGRGNYGVVAVNWRPL